MVRVTRNSKTSNRVAGYAPSHHNPILDSPSPAPRATRGLIARSAVDRERAIANAMQSKKGAEVKAKARSCTSRQGTTSIPAADLLNELPVRVRQEVEAIRNCCLPCLPASHRPSYATPQFLVANLHKHQLFSKEHAGNLDPEIRQWLPRLVCPAFPLSPKCRGQGQRCDSMLRHLQICKPFQALFPDEYRKLFPRAQDPKLPADDEYKLLKMTFGQLVFLSVKLGKDRKGKKYKFVSMSASTIKRALHSWRPFSKPGMQAISPSDFPPVRIPQFFYTSGVEGATTEEENAAPSGYDADLDTGSSSSSSASTPIRMPLPIADEQMQQDVPTSSPLSLPTPMPIPTPEPESFYPELYLPPHLLPPTCDASYLKAAIEAHAPEIDAFSPLLNVPISSFSAEVPRDWSVSDAGAFSEYDLFSLEGGANDPFREFDHVFHSCDRLLHASETPLFSQLPESGLVPSQVFIA
ncbi:hypothetical protein V8E53_004866 [Lactarius tabidus]